MWIDMRRLVLFLMFLIFSVLPLKAQKVYQMLFISDQEYCCDKPMLLKINALFKYEGDCHANVVLHVKNENGNTTFWKSFPIERDFNVELMIPSHELYAPLKCFIYNPKREKITVDSVNYSLEFISLPSFVPENLEVKKSETAFLVEDSVQNNFNVSYSDKEKYVEFWHNNEAVTMPVSLLLNDNQYFEWEKLCNDSTEYSFLNENDLIKTEMRIISREGNPNVHFDMKTEFLEDVEISRFSIIIPFTGKDFVVYRTNLQVDTLVCQDEYYLDQEGFSYKWNDFQLNLYHPKLLSSIQLDAKNSIAVLNLDYDKDHTLIHYPAKADTIEYYVEKSKRMLKKGDIINSSFDFSITQHIDLPRLMPVWDGYESGIVWTEHADWTDIRTHRAVYFGNEDVTCADSAVGGFVYYGIPVTKSVFYCNPDKVSNVIKNRDFPRLHSSIKGDSVYLDFLKQLRDRDFEICLHTPDQYTTTREILSEALSFMKENFGSPTWIDHGYNNSYVNNRENLVCDGLDEKSRYFAYDIWKENGLRYFWNAYNEELRQYGKWGFSSNLQHPYPFWGDAFPKPRFMRLPDDPEMLLWSTEYTTEPGASWDYYFRQNNLDVLVESRSVFISHTYPAWVETKRGFWDMGDGKVVAKEEFNKALERIASLRDRRLLLPTTIEKYLKYQEQLQCVDYQFDNDGNVILKNNNPEAVQGLTLISKSPLEVMDKMTSRRMSKGECVVWFDMEPYETVKIIVAK